MDRASSLAAKVVEHAGLRPDAPALVWRGQVTSYAQLCGMMYGAGAEIASLKPGVVGILAHKSVRAVSLILGAILARRPVFIPAPGLPLSTLRTMFERAGCVRVVSPDDGWDAGADLIDRVVQAAWTRPDGTVPPDDPERVGLTLTTSGSTGVPKIVPLTVGAMDRFAAWAHRQFNLGPGRSVLNYAPLNFDLCLFDIWATLASGGCVLLVDSEQVSNARLLESLIAWPVHVIEAVPMFYELLIDAAGHTGDQLETVEHVLFTGDAIRPGCLAELPKLFPNARFYNLYGSTETNDSFLHEVNVEVEHDSPLPLGEPLPGVNAILVDGTGAAITGPGIGELYVTTPFQTGGYLNSSGNEKFVPHPEAIDDRTYFRTGDMVRRHPDGTLTFHGRNDFLVKVRGQQVNLQEIEQTLLQHDQVMEAAVVSVAHPIAGRQVQALVRRRPGSGLTGVDVRAFCADRLATASIPATVRIMDRPLPRTSTGKISRRDVVAGAATAVAEATLTLSESEAEQVRRICLSWAAELAGHQLDSEHVMTSIELAGCALPVRLVRELISFRCNGNAYGTLVVENLPVDADLPPTPVEGRLADWQVARVATIAQLAAMSHLGDLIGFSDEKHGELVQDIVPLRGAGGRQENSGTVFLEMHTENGFHPFKPDFLSLLCLRPDLDRSGNTLTAAIARVLPDLSRKCVQLLRQRLFRIRYSSSFENGGSRGKSGPVAVLSGPYADPELIADFHAMEALTAEAKAALAQLEEALRGVLVRVRHEPGTLLIVDNRAATHGRTAFAARFDGTDRWLRRSFAVADLRRSRGSRAAGSRVCAPLGAIEQQLARGSA